MSEPSMNGLTRRDFLGKTAILAGAAPFAAGFFPFAAGSAAGYGSFTSDEARFTEAVVNALCPADRLTPDGATCGLARFVDRQLAGEFGAQASSHWLLGNEAFFKQGVAGVNALSRRRFGVPFERLEASRAAVLLAEIASGRAGDPALTAWYRQVVDPLLVRASLSGPVYERYGSTVFSKLFA